MPTIETDDLSIAYEDGGNGERRTVVLLHDWLDDASIWVAEVPALNQAVDASDSGEAIKPILMMQPGAA